MMREPRANGKAESLPEADPAGPRVSVVLPFFDAEAHLAAALSALEGQVGAPDFEVLLVDNASSDAGPVAARAFVAADAERRRLVREERPGSYAARNAGVARARGRFLLFLDADCTPGPAWVRTLSAALESGAGLVGGPVRARSDRTGWLARYARRADVLAQKGALEHPYGPFLQTANLGVTREILEAVDGFDAELPTGGDADFCWRVAQTTGVRPRLLGEEAVVHHFHRESLGALWRQYRRYGQADVLLYRRHGRPGLRPVLKAGLDLLRVLLAPLLALLRVPEAAANRDPLPVLTPLLRAFRVLARRRGQVRAWCAPRRLFRA